MNPNTRTRPTHTTAYDGRGYNADWSITRTLLGGPAESDAYCRRCRERVASGWPSDLVPAMQRHEDVRHDGVLNMARDNTYDAAVRRAHGLA